MNRETVPFVTVRFRTVTPFSFVSFRSGVYFLINRTLFSSFHSRFSLHTFCIIPHKISESCCVVFWFAYCTDRSATSVHWKSGSPGRQTSAKSISTVVEDESVLRIEYLNTCPGSIRVVFYQIPVYWIWSSKFLFILIVSVFVVFPDFSQPSS